MLGFNIEVTLNCRTNEDAKKVADSLTLGDLRPVVEDTLVRIIAKNVGGMAMAFLIKEIGSNKLIIDKSFHHIPL